MEELAGQKDRQRKIHVGERNGSSLLVFARFPPENEIPGQVQGKIKGVKADEDDKKAPDVRR